MTTCNDQVVSLFTSLFLNRIVHKRNLFFSSFIPIPLIPLMRYQRSCLSYKYEEHPEKAVRINEKYPLLQIFFCRSKLKITYFYFVIQPYSCKCRHSGNRVLACFVPIFQSSNCSGTLQFSCLTFLKRLHFRTQGALPLTQTR